MGKSDSFYNHAICLMTMVFLLMMIAIKIDCNSLNSTSFSDEVLVSIVVVSQGLSVVQFEPVVKPI